MNSIYYINVEIILLFNFFSMIAQKSVRFCDRKIEILNPTYLLLLIVQMSMFESIHYSELPQPIINALNDDEFINTTRIFFDNINYGSTKFYGSLNNANYLCSITKNIYGGFHYLFGGDGGRVLYKVSKSLVEGFLCDKKICYVLTNN